MTSLRQLETYTNDLSAAAKLLIQHGKEIGPGDGELHRARRSILGITEQLQILLAEPADFLQHLASQNQVLACLQWLGEFQVLAYVPLKGSVSIRDVAELAGVSESQLSRIIRMMATSGFLSEPSTGRVSHTPLSSPFVHNLAYLDAAMYLAETAAPAALKMACATARGGGDTAYGLAFSTGQSFEVACKQRAKLQRGWGAWRACVEREGEGNVVGELLGKLDWNNLGNSCVVDVGATSTSTATALSKLDPWIRFIVQMDDPAYHTYTSTSPPPNPRIEVQKRSTPSLPQPIHDAAVYLLHFPPSPSSSHPLKPRILSELSAHLSELRSNSFVILILPSCLLPQPGTVDPCVERQARMRDLGRSQLSNECDMEIEELVEWVNSVHDSMGWLLVMDKLWLRGSSTVALAVKYQGSSGGGGGDVGLVAAGGLGGGGDWLTGGLMGGKEGAFGS